MKSRLPLLLVAGLCAVGAVEARVQFLRAHIHPALKSGKTAIRKVVLLPPLVQLNKVTMKGSESMSAESERLAGSLYLVLAGELAARGVEVLPDPMAAATTNAAKYAISNLQAKYDNVLVQLRRKPNRVDQGTLTLGDGVASFEPAKGADALVLVRGSAISASPGKKAAILIGIGALSSFQGDISFVDARTGDVLAWTRISRQADVSKDAIDRLARSARTALRDIPLPTAPPAPEKI